MRSDGQRLLIEESEKCDVTGKIVVPGVLMRCEASSKRVPALLAGEICCNGKRALGEFFVSSSVSGIRALKLRAFLRHLGNTVFQLRQNRVCGAGRRFNLTI